MEIRAEHENDHADIFRLNVDAFGNREDESLMIERVRRSDRFIPELSLVTAKDGEIVGHVLFSEADVEAGEDSHRVIVLGPIAVKPGHQGHGIGGMLIKEGLNRAAGLGYELVFLIGHPSYYPKFGFRPGREHGFELTQFNVPDEVFMVHILKEDTQIKGELKYPPAFFG